MNARALRQSIRERQGELRDATNERVRHAMRRELAALERERREARTWH